MLRRAALDEDAGELVGLPHAGQEVGDVIEVNAATLGLDAAGYRVTSVRLEYVMAGRPSSRGARASMTLGLGEV